MDFDVAVVGAGPAGSVSAKEIAAAGYKVLLLEEHDVVGQPVHCSGLISPRTLEATGLDNDIVLNSIKGAVVYTPMGNTITVGGNRTHALVIDRALMDEGLARKAQEAGAVLALRSRLASMQRSDDGVRLHVQRGSEKAEQKIDVRLVIGADGSHSAVAKGMGTGQSEESIVAVGGEISMQSQHDDMVEVYVQPDLAPGWFGWTIPLGTDVSRIGIGSDEQGRNPRRLLEGLMESHEHLRDSSVLRLQGGVIPVAPLRQIAEPRAMLVGDAAGQVKPTSGGGIHTSILSAKICADVAIEALERGALGEEAAARYRTEWMRTVGLELYRGRLLRHMLAQLTPVETEQLLQLFTLKEVCEVMAAQGDIDFPVHLFSHLFRPAVVFRVLRALPLRLWPRLAWLLVQWYRKVSNHQPGLQ
mgnify:CR=1 FL=1